ncbi:hypothetical protein GLOIN_2v1770135 [Rhizophagus irregularis DAOM 181602=DAOM 197198]|uniref:Uncharacterized protein n=1 Tax=Rhizophagus irregularis (strain DAOM 181602 / DAOM 197198 / MUCL 43194) TaxID=747089 RepID=A0A2P4QCX0_RHIID|nr:hypothetical protein GLOIN_2v1770135 [Rhizophagus irregularis DAOM 181602=DAOM 197198]POG75491.1 hypothetical protein GLOIN_2v1770135 [Rhizophagus irregularis DAOM 181602=DAOM 197198]|eukprot:XP_025182357.1 hypothetical protein GLOIN_2v1770135 [Rhizophagus irregularis DAOM 181602=DAOM 197198]
MEPIDDLVWNSEVCSEWNLSMILVGIQRFRMEPIDDFSWNLEFLKFGVSDGTYQRYWNSEVLNGTYQRFWNSEVPDGTYQRYWNSEVPDGTYQRYWDSEMEPIKDIGIQSILTSES